MSIKMGNLGTSLAIDQSLYKNKQQCREEQSGKMVVEVPYTVGKQCPPQQRTEAYQVEPACVTHT